ncbi:unnamed protein product [Mytilus edulis]|uniref:Uncharacterized protein n=1 Tax=Mytilus edulis TaxID=6550 RepID=A0A8S3R6Q3_MYTED|nr:unnamed protein product [Mytilus edulis]
MEACDNGAISIVKLLLAKGADINITDTEGRTPFYLSCRSGNADLVDLMIDKKCELYKANNHGKTPLMSACNGGHLSIVEKLIELNARINIADKSGKTPFYWACVGGNICVVELLISKGCIVSADNDGKTPLMAVCCKEQDILGADIAGTDKKGRTPFFWSCCGGNINVVKLLMAKRCDIDKANKCGITPLMEASKKEHVSVVKLLIEKADLTITDEDEQTIFFLACAVGCDINQPNNDGVTPLMKACSQGHLPIIKLLIEKVGDLNVTDSDGQTLYYWSGIGGIDVQIKTLLKNKGCDIK